MNIYLLIALISLSVSGCFNLTRQLQMLQQNSYFPSRYFDWLKTNISLGKLFIYLIVSILFSLKQYVLLMIFSAFVLGLSVYSTISLQKKSIKKLVFTARVKRLYIAAIIILLALITIYCVSPESIAGKLSVIINLLISSLTPILTFIIWAITFPIEKIFAFYYTANAKKILKSYNNIKIIGVTGSYGKTTTKFILTRILSEKFNVVCTPQSFNTPMGVVRTVRENLEPQTQIFVCEMGAKNIGDIKEICNIANPNYALITSVGPQHLETFKTVDNVFNTKFELADAVLENGGLVFANGDSQGIIERVDKNSVSLYGTNDGFNYYCKNIKCTRFGCEFEVCVDNETIKLSTKLLGMHNIINITGAVALAYKLGVSASDIKYAVASLKPTEHRLELKNYINASLLIDDAYNANPEGCLEAVRVLSTFKNMKKVIITPGLVELGDKEYDYNYNLGLEAAKYCDIIILVGKNRSKPMVDAVNSTDFNKDNLFVVSSFKEALEIYTLKADSNTVVLFENDLPDNYLN